MSAMSVVPGGLSKRLRMICSNQTSLCYQPGHQQDAASRQFGKSASLTHSGQFRCACEGAQAFILLEGSRNSVCWKPTSIILHTDQPHSFVSFMVVFKYHHSMKLFSDHHQNVKSLEIWGLFFLLLFSLYSSCCCIFSIICNCLLDASYQEHLCQMLLLGAPQREILCIFPP